ncbi:MAG: AAA family ATPase [Saprospiraceae bacterium]|nr:AAA family ATPase [Saprospiraceae bacterium]
MLLLLAGLPGSGKTTVARAFAALSGARHFNSDALRRELGLMGHYRPEDKENVYATLLQRARESLKRGEMVVVDSTFFKESVREPFRALAAECGVPLRWVEVQAEEPTLRLRLSHPRPDSEADFKVYETIRDQFEPLPEDRFIVHTDTETPESAAEKILQYLNT